VKRSVLGNCHHGDPIVPGAGPALVRPAQSVANPSSGTSWEFEIQFERDGDNPGLDKFHIHVRCFAAWEFERRQDGPLTVSSLRPS
jgi:hypothetical protein